MHPYVLLAGRVILGGTGVLLIYVALFLYEEEEGRLENRLEQWWQRIRRLHSAAISKEIAFLRVVIQLTSNGLNQLFGKRLLGLQAVTASVSYSVTASYLFLMLYFMFRLKIYEPKMFFFVSVGVSLFVGVFLLREPRRNLLRQWIYLLFMAAFAIYVFRISLSFNPALGRYGSSGLAVCVLILAVISDVFFLALIRALLNWVSQAKTFTKMFAVSVAIGAAGVSMTLFPLLAASPFRSFRDSKATFFLLLGSANCLDMIVSLAWLGLAATMLLHRVIWPIAERPIYALYRHQVFTKHRTLVLFSGMAILGLAVPSVGEALAKVVKEIHG